MSTENNMTRSYDASVIQSHIDFTTNLLFSNGVYQYLHGIFTQDLLNCDLGASMNSTIDSFLRAELPVTVSMEVDEFNPDEDLYIYRLEKFNSNGERFNPGQYGLFVFLRNEEGEADFREEDLLKRTEIKPEMRELIISSFDKILEHQKLTGFELIK